VTWPSTEPGWPSTAHSSEGGAYHAIEEREAERSGARERSRAVVAQITGTELDPPQDDTFGTLCVAARRLDLLYGHLPASHLSLMLRYTTGESIEYEGAPTRAVPGAYGPIVVRKRPFRPRPDRQGVVVAYVRRRLLNDWEQALDNEMERLNAAMVVYEPVNGPNSNTVIRTLLLRLWLPPLQPAALPVGFDHEAL